MALNPMDLTGRCVLITGASSGLGRATAILMSRLGARLLLLGRNVERLRQTLAALEGEGHGVLEFDLNNVDGIVPMLTEQAAKFSPLSGLVHAAGITQTRPLQVCRPEDYESIYRVNVVAASQLLRGLTKPRIVLPTGCSAVIIGSDMSIRGLPGLSSYASSKAAVLGLVRCAALELARFHIRVNAVLPGHFGGESEMDRDFRQHVPAENVRKLEELYPLGFGRSEDVANAVAFLIADTARWITGSSLVVDGGRTVH